LDNWLRPDAGHLLHVHQVAAGESALPREGRLQIRREPGHDLRSPALLLLPGEDQFADLPVQTDEFGVHGPLGAEACAGDRLLDLAQEIAVPGRERAELGGDGGVGRLGVPVHGARVPHGDLRK